MEAAEDKRLEAEAKKPAFVLPHNIIDDWTGQRYLEPCQGKEPCDEVKPSLIQQSALKPAAAAAGAKPAAAKTLVQVDASVDVSADPYDPNLADVQKIMD